jgi:pimeloyl-ACP methyl ester carboxylesterase
MIRIFVCLLFVSLCFAYSTKDLIKKQGCIVETYKVTTDDGYILTMFRIPPKVKGARPVLLQHGLLDSSNTFVNNERNNTLAFILHDEGYDVWLGNVRGNTYSNEHKEYKLSDSRYWDFTFHEMAQYDIPAMIDYILKYTSHQKLVYVGHSQGTQIGFIRFTDPLIAKKVELFIALAPVTGVRDIGTPLVKPISWFNLPKILSQMGIMQFPPQNSFINRFAPSICNLMGGQCLNLFCTIVGCNETPHFNKSRMETYMGGLPAGTSMRNMLHWSQTLETGYFKAFDYGHRLKNQRVYGRDTPPLYPLHKLSVPTMIYYGDHDALASVSDTRRLLSRLPQHMILRKKLIPEYGHMDLVWALDVGTRVYKDVLSIIKKYH